MDKLYIGDIPSEYCYARFSDNHIDLYNTNVLHNGVFDYYRIYTSNKGFYYSFGTSNISQYTTEYLTQLDVTQDVCYRSDFDSILFITFIFVLFGVFLFNIVTSLIRKGGLLGGLL